MDAELRAAFEQAKKELTHIHYRWIMFVQIFGTNSHRIDIINQTSSNLIMEFHWLVLDNMVQAVCRLTDPAKMRGNSNLSLPYLIQLVDKRKNRHIVPELNEILHSLYAATKRFREIRNKRLSHNDLVAALGNAESPLPGISREDVNNALKLVGNFLNKIEITFMNKMTLYDKTILPLTNDGRSLLIRLQKSLAYDQLESAGTIDNGQWRELGNID